jgi:serine/threonine protein phosphatase 1
MRNLSDGLATQIKEATNQNKTVYPSEVRAMMALLVDRTTSPPTKGSMPGRLFAIGDIHGCSSALKSLIEAIKPAQDDIIVTLGDYVDYGPDSRSVIDQLIQVSHRCRLVPLLGNHEEMLSQALESDSALRSWLDIGGDQTLLSYPYDGTNIIDLDHVEFVRGCLDYFETDDFIFAHANCDPALPMDRQPSLKLRWEFLDVPRQQPHFSGKTVIVGHTPQTSGEVLNLDFLCCIDTDCSRGGWLTALNVGNGDLIQANEKGEVRSRTLIKGSGIAGPRDAE